MKKRHLFIVTALVGASLLMLAPVAYAGGGGGGGTVVNAGGSCGWVEAPHPGPDPIAGDPLTEA